MISGLLVLNKPKGISSGEFIRKLKPLIKIIRQKIQNKILKYLYKSKLSNQAIVVDLIPTSLTRKKNKIITNCKKNFFNGFFNNHTSDNSTIKKNTHKNIYNNISI